MPKPMIRIWPIFCLAFTAQVLAETIRVPDDFPTIQNALNALSESDTLLIASGVYEEALYAPPHSFWIIGLTEDSTGLGVIVDPTNLEDSDTLACLSVPFGATPYVENLTFRNGPEMLEGRQSNRPGGIICSSVLLSFSRCAFDSLFWGILSAPGLLGAQLSLSDCQFKNCLNASVMIPNCALVANNSSFEAVGLNNVYAGSFTTLSGCTLRANSFGHLGAFYGDNLQLTNCVFGPSGPTAFRAVEFETANARIESCEFTNLLLGSAALAISVTCGSDSVIVQNCSFHNCVVQLGQGVSGMTSIYHVLPSPCDTNPVVLIKGNHFFELMPNVETRASRLTCEAQVMENSFESHLDENYSVHWTEYSAATLRDNSFSQASLACRAEVFGDARWNWWGDLSGPYHTVSNPGGNGAQIEGDIDFIPWLQEPPSNTILQKPIPGRFEVLKSYPNPFNSSVTIEYALTREQEVEVIIFDLLGREIDKLVDERQQTGVHQTVWRADNFASGIYFTRLSSAHSAQPAMTTKLLLLK